MHRCLNRNKRKEPIWYSLYKGVSEDTTQKGQYTLYTGDRDGEYTEPVPVRVNVSDPTGYVSTGTFGTEINYEKVLVYDWTGPIEINEYSKLWVDVKPYKDGVLQPCDYTVKKVQVNHDKTEYVVVIERVTKRNE